MFCTQAKHGVNCLELPLIQHRHLPDLERLSSILRGMLSGLCGVAELCRDMLLLIQRYDMG